MRPQVTEGTEMTDEAAADVHWLSDAEQRSWRAYLRGSRLLESALDAALREAGLQLSEYEVISMLSEADGNRLRMSDLAALVVQSRSRLTHTASRLERRGWVTREPCLDDKRGIELVLTRTGRLVVIDVSRLHLRDVRENFIDLLTPEQFQALGDTMSIIREHLDPKGLTTDRWTGPG